MLEAMTTKRTVLNPLTHLRHTALRDEVSGEKLALETGSSMSARSQGQLIRRSAK